MASPPAAAAPAASASPASVTASVSWGARAWGLLLVLSGNMLIDALEVSVAIVALPSIGADLHLPLASLHWVVSGFALGFGAVLLFSGRITAAFGRRRVYLAALLVFAAASLVGGLADDGALLIATRVVKGCCAALTAPTGLAIISTAFREGAERGRAVSVYSLFGASGFTAGLVLSGVLTQSSSWRWTFSSPAPVALVLFLFALRLMPRDEPVAAAAPAVVRLGRLFTNGPLVRSALGAAVLNGCYWGFLLVTTLRLQSLHGWTPLRTGLALLPASVPLLLAALLSGRMVRVFGTAPLIALGSLAPPLGYALYLRADPPSAYPTGLLPTLVLVGTGFVLAFAALHMQATCSVPDTARASAGALYQSAVQIGGVVTLVLVVALLGPHADAHADYRSAVALITAIGAAGFLLALAGLPRGARERSRARSRDTADSQAGTTGK